MPDLQFKIDGVEVIPYAASPQLAFKLRVDSGADDAGKPVAVHSVMLRCQIRLEPVQRRYDPAEQEQLQELFGEPQRWGQTLRSMLWTNTMAVIPPFAGKTQVDLPIACTFDFNIAATKYFAALDSGEVPLSFLFSGTVFYADENGSLQVQQISWEREATFRLPISVWKKMMEMYYPNIAWLSVRQDVFDRLNAYRIQCGQPTWEGALEHLLGGPEPKIERQVSL